MCSYEARDGQFEQLDNFDERVLLRAYDLIATATNARRVSSFRVMRQDGDKVRSKMAYRTACMSHVNGRLLNPGVRATEAAITFLAVALRGSR